MKKIEEVRQLLRLGFTISETAFWTKVSRRKVYLVKWRDEHPRYHADKMAQYRAQDPDGKYAEQIKRASQKNTERYYSDPEFRAKRLNRAKSKNSVLTD